MFAARLLAGEPCTIHGDGEQTRDFVYVDDCVDAFVRAADRGDGLVINIGTGVETSVNDLYAAMAGATGVDRPARQAAAPRARSSARRSTPAGPPSSSAGARGRRSTRASPGCSTGTRLAPRARRKPVLSDLSRRIAAEV